MLSHAAFAFADPEYGANKKGLDDKELVWDHDYLIDYADVVTVTPGIVSIFEFARRTSMPYRWSLSCWISNGMTRGEIGFGNWIYTAAFSRESLYRNDQDFYKCTIRNDNEANLHPTRKPIDFVMWLMGLFSAEGDYVIDPFVGSGQTLIAAEKLGRKSIVADINPAFCAVAIRRWEYATGKKAERVA
jgi:DNA modification methylase